MRVLITMLLITQASLCVAESAKAPVIVRDDQQRVIQVTEPDGHIWLYERDTLGRMVSVMTGIGERWTVAYYPDGTAAVIRSPQGPVDLAGATPVWSGLSLVLQRPGKPDQTLISEPH